MEEKTGSKLKGTMVKKPESEAESVIGNADKILAKTDVSATKAPEKEFMWEIPDSGEKVAMHQSETISGGERKGGLKGTLAKKAGIEYVAPKSSESPGFAKEEILTAESKYVEEVKESTVPEYAEEVKESTTPEYVEEVKEFTTLKVSEEVERSELVKSVEKKKKSHIHESEAETGASETGASEKSNFFKNIYLIDFFAGLFKKQNIPMIIYLILNVVIIGLIVMVVFSLNFWIALLQGFLLYFASVTIAVSPIGEWILRKQNGCRKIDEVDVVKRIYPIYTEVLKKAREKTPAISPDVRLFMAEDDAPNAFATGRKTICITRGLLQLSDDEIKGILAHEFGHLAHKDTDKILVVAVGNMIITAICMICQAIITIIYGIMMLAAASQDEDSFVYMAGTAVMKFLTLITIHLVMKLWTAIGVALCMKTNRANEYLADQYSFELGYGAYLCSGLDSIGDEAPEGLFASLASSHPKTPDRIARLVEMGADYDRGWGELA